MTTIAYCNGVLAADSANTVDGVVQSCQKIVRKVVGKEEHIIAMSGSSLASLFLDWYGSGKPAPATLEVGEPEENGWGAVVLTPAGLFFYNGCTIPDKILSPRFASGCGAAAALGAMAYGAGARRAVEIATEIDPNTRGPVISMRLRH